ncbi:MAG: hypothetical protein EON60_09860 [Alphaproteobacteria bacterium]|nr:MAG: hypothetical protein EON60_09860 [Alphaproteobacteria bacterium]
MKLTFLAVVGTVVLTTACAHAAPANICPAGTKTAVLYQPPSGDNEFPLEFPPDTGAYGESTTQTWDISGVPDSFKVDCYPNAVGFSGKKTATVPAGSSSCAFDTAAGVFSCQ